MASQERIHSLDAVRAFALLLGIVFHAAMSFLPGMIPGAWAAVDSSPSATLAVVSFGSHMFRMSLFFVMAGFFAHLLLVRRGARGFWTDRLKRVGIPLIVGWVLIFPMVAVVLIWGIKRTFAGLPPQSMPHMPAPPRGYFPLAHFWFLYYLLILYVLIFAVRALIARVDPTARLRALADRGVALIVRHPAVGLLLGLPLAVVLYRLPEWKPVLGIPTPDSSLIPQLPAMVAFGTAFTFGWLLYRQQFGNLRRAGGYLIVAIALTATCLALGDAAPKAVSALDGVRSKLNALPDGIAKLAFALAYAGAIWAWIFGLIGLAMRHLNGESRVRRYLADSSYWLYLTHLPLVMALQVLVAPLHAPWFVKYPFILAVTFAVLLTSYHYVVRPTFIGELLNGRKYPRRRPGQRAAAVEESAPAPTSPEVLAELRGVHKRYGKTVALEGVDLQVRRGELLALLGPNGAGKSTAISLCLGLTEPDTGEVHLLGRTPRDVESRRHIGVMMQEVMLPPELCVSELVALAGSYYPQPLPPRRVLQMTGAESIAARRYGKLSGGQKRLAQFALAVCGRPQLLFLDEPTVGLDVQAREAMWRTIREQVAQGCGVVLTTHYLEEAEALADRVAVLSAGRLIASGSVDEIRSVVSRKEIRCSSSVALELVRQWPGVTQVSRDTKRLHITAIDAEAVVRLLLAADPNLRNLEVRQAGLAEAFAELTKEAA
jgi:ABC-type multidrug transport system ATPase subunit/peptidoglycan/LPS O-acetylase OafA/YrhL